MKTLLQSFRVCEYQLRTLSKNYKIYTIAICMSIFMWNDMEVLRIFMSSVHENASPFLFPFLFTDEFLTALMFTGILLFFIDAPFYNKDQLFVVMRSGIRKWCLGQILYIPIISFFYTLFLSVLSILVMFPHISFSSDWGKIWTTLAVTDAVSEFAMPFFVPTSTIYSYTPLQALLLVLLLSVLICSFYGFAMWCFNLYFGKTLSFVLVLASVFLVTRIRYLPPWLMYLTPSAWANLGVLSEFSFHGISVSRALTILLLGNLCLGTLAFFKTTHMDLAK